MISDIPRGWLFVLVGPGGAGKNALLRAVMQRLAHLSQIATATTRSPRPGEQHGREHLFVSHDEFQQMIANRELLEWQEVTRNKFYGIPRSSIERKLAIGEDLIADIDVLGAQILRDTYPDDTVLVFITVPGDTETDKVTVLRQRLGNAERNEPESTITERMARAQTLEFPFEPQCDYVIINDELEAAVEQLLGIIMARRDMRRQVMKGQPNGAG